MWFFRCAPLAPTDKLFLGRNVLALLCTLPSVSFPRPHASVSRSSSATAPAQVLKGAEDVVFHLFWWKCTALCASRVSEYLPPAFWRRCCPVVAWSSVNSPEVNLCFRKPIHRFGKWRPHVSKTDGTKTMVACTTHWTRLLQQRWWGAGPCNRTLCLRMRPSTNTWAKRWQTPMLVRQVGPRTLSLGITYMLQQIMQQYPLEQSYKCGM